MIPMILLAASLLVVALGCIGFLFTYKGCNCAHLTELSPEQRAKRKRDEEFVLLVSAAMLCFQVLFLY